MKQILALLACTLLTVCATAQGRNDLDTIKAKTPYKVQVGAFDSSARSFPITVWMSRRAKPQTFDVTNKPALISYTSIQSATAERFSIKVVGGTIKQILFDVCLKRSGPGERPTPMPQIVVYEEEYVANPY